MKKSVVSSMALFGIAYGLNPSLSLGSETSQVWEVRGKVSIRYIKKTKSGRVVREEVGDYGERIKFGKPGTSEVRIAFSTDKQFCKVYLPEAHFSCTVNSVPAGGLIYSSSSLPMAFSNGSVQCGNPGDSLSVTMDTGTAKEFLKEVARQSVFEYPRHQRRVEKALLRGTVDPIVVDREIVTKDSGAKYRRGRTHAVGYKVELSKALFAPTGEPARILAGNFAMKLKDGNGTVYPILSGLANLVYTRDGRTCFLELDPIRNVKCEVYSIPQDNSNPFGGEGNRKLMVRVSSQETLRLMIGLNNHGNVSTRSSVAALLAALDASHRSKNISYELNVNSSHTLQDFNEGTAAPILDDSISLEIQF